MGGLGVLHGILDGVGRDFDAGVAAQKPLKGEIPAGDDGQVAVTGVGQRAAQGEQPQGQVALRRLLVVGADGHGHADLALRPADRPGQPHRAGALAQQGHVQGGEADPALHGLGLLDDQVVHLAQGMADHAHRRRVVAGVQLDRHRRLAAAQVQAGSGLADSGVHLLEHELPVLFLVHFVASGQIGEDEQTLEGRLVGAGQAEGLLEAFDVVTDAGAGVEDVAEAVHGVLLGGIQAAPGAADRGIRGVSRPIPRRGRPGTRPGSGFPGQRRGSPDRRPRRG